MTVIVLTEDKYQRQLEIHLGIIGEILEIAEKPNTTSSDVRDYITEKYSRSHLQEKRKQLQKKGGDSE